MYTIILQYRQQTKKSSTTIRNLPSCTISHYKPRLVRYCILERPPNVTYIKISVPQQVFSYERQNQFISYKTTDGIRAKGSVYRKHSKILIFYF